MQKKVLLIYPNTERIYEKSSIHLLKYLKGKKGKVNFAPILGIAALAAPLLKAGHEVKIFDMNIPENDKHELKKFIKKFSPDFVGITFNTALVKEAEEVAEIAKKSKNIIVIGGGPHASSFPEQTMREMSFDIICFGEADFTLLEIVGEEKKDWHKIKGVCFRQGKRIIKTPSRELINDLDVLPFPAWELFDIQRYKSPSVIAKKNPAGWIETSRGCVFGCCYCNKSVFGRTFRVKSPKRVASEIKHMLALGFRELFIADDACTTDVKRMKQICEEIIKQKIRVPWSTLTGIRVDTLDQECLDKMRQAGCYRVYFGIESGNQKVLDGIGKGITLEKVKAAVKMAKKAGLEVYGFFMLALPGETEQSMRDTINFAKSLDLDMAKASITIPLPATPLFEQLERKGFIKSRNWADFNLYANPQKIYTHPGLDWNTVDKYNSLFYKELYLNPRFALKRFVYGLRHGTIFSDLIILARSRLWKTN